MKLLKYLIVISVFLSTSCHSMNNELDKVAKVLVKDQFLLEAYQRIDSKIDKEVINIVFSINYTGKNPIDFTELELELSNSIDQSFNWFTCKSNSIAYPIFNVTPIQYFGTVPKIDFLISLNHYTEMEDKLTLSFNPNVQSLEFLSSEFQIKLKKVL